MMWERRLLISMLVVLMVKGYQCQTTEPPPEPECQLDCSVVDDDPSSILGFTNRDLCNLGCKADLPPRTPHGRPKLNSTSGKCECRCFFAHTGHFCERGPSCPPCLSRCGTLRSGDCTCRCTCGSITGAECERAYCPHLENFGCAGFSGSCGNVFVQLACPYTCNVEGCIGRKPTCENDPECHESAAGCIYRGKRPTPAMCQTLGDHGADVAGVCGKEALDGGKCGRCFGGFIHDSLFSLAYCPVYCGLCPETTRSTTSLPTEITNFTTIISIFTSQVSLETDPEDSSVALIAGVTVGVLVILIIGLLIIVCLRRRKQNATDKKPRSDVTTYTNSNYDDVIDVRPAFVGISSDKEIGEHTTTYNHALPINANDNKPRPPAYDTVPGDFMTDHNGYSGPQDGYSTPLNVRKNLDADLTKVNMVAKQAAVNGDSNSKKTPRNKKEKDNKKAEKAQDNKKDTKGNDKNNSKSIGQKNALTYVEVQKNKSMENSYSANGRSPKPSARNPTDYATVHVAGKTGKSDNVYSVTNDNPYDVTNEDSYDVTYNLTSDIEYGKVQKGEDTYDHSNNQKGVQPKGQTYESTYQDGNKMAIKAGTPTSDDFYYSDIAKVNEDTYDHTGSTLPKPPNPTQHEQTYSSLYAEGEQKQ